MLIRERIERETDVARRWWNVPRNTVLPLADGQQCLLISHGTPGGSAGPDVRDAVLCFLPRASSLCSWCSQEVPEITGDVEFHTHASDWFTHNHHTDANYNRVVLHVALVLDGPMPTRRQDGSAVPTLSFFDVPHLTARLLNWPCQRRSDRRFTSTLLAAGLLRFLERRLAFLHELIEGQASADTQFDTYNLHLLPALAEGLGYGRDRAFFRMAGQKLAGLSMCLSEPEGRVPQLGPLDAQRLRILSALHKRWRQAGAWSTLRQALQQGNDVKTAIAALRAAFQPLSRARTDILICNIALPFAAAVADLENEAGLAVRAHQIYLAYPQLASNRITRMMSAQLQLPEEPEQACLQQGLQHIYTQTCRAKNCQHCLCGGKPL